MRMMVTRVITWSPHPEETVRWYGELLGTRVVPATDEDRRPGTHAPAQCMQLLLDAGGGNILAFFELAHSPAWVQRIALKAGSVDERPATWARVATVGSDVLDTHGLLAQRLEAQPGAVHLIRPGRRSRTADPNPADRRLRRLLRGIGRSGARPWRSGGPEDAGHAGADPGPSHRQPRGAVAGDSAGRRLALEAT